jgi:pSer/pThr/pTyr-binding forkhead associated (FHA) protein
MKPLGAGDPIPLLKTEVTIGRRPSCDIQLDFENVSGKHCQLRYVNQIWHVRDLGSTNGTKLNGATVAVEHTVMPDDELAIASHAFNIDYEPGGPASVTHREGYGEKPTAEPTRQKSLLELAGLASDEDRPRARKSIRPEKAPQGEPERLSADLHDFEDPLPKSAKADPAPIIDTSDDDFLKLIEDDVNEKFDKGKK